MDCLIICLIYRCKNCSWDFHTLQSRKYFLTNTTLLQHILHNRSNNTPLNSTPSRPPHTRNLRIATGNRLLSGARSTNDRTILCVRYTAARQSGRGINGADGKELQWLLGAAADIARNGDSEHSICNGDFFAVGVEDDVLAHRDN